jgi:hypothetical protein
MSIGADVLTPLRYKLTEEVYTMKRRFSLAIAGLALFAAGVPLIAHHSPRAGNDSTKTVSIKGILTKVEWRNPHLEFYLDVKDQNGRIINWHIDSASPNLFVKQGLTRQMLQEGDQISVEIWAAKDGHPSGNGRLLTLSDGRTFSGASIWDNPRPIPR